MYTKGGKPHDKPFVELESPDKAEHDKKEYKVIKLKNGLTALLIHKPDEGDDNLNDTASTVSSQASETAESMDEGSDAEGSNSSDSEPAQTHQSAASLTIGVGSFEDPDELPGLAHFLEHMVFMGSEKYPEENNFDAFIKKQGGEDNASTDWETTTFYFVSQTQGFKDALDRFAQFFISPLLKKEAMQREREAIESEFNLALPSDYHRKKQLLGTLAKKNHPAAKFAWGNVKTLGGTAGEKQNETDSNVHGKLREFREKHYTAESMTLAIQSTHDLATMQEWVLESFGAVPSANLDKNITKEVGANLDLEAPFDTPEFKKLYYVAPVKDVQEVQLTWSLPSMMKKYESKPDRYLSWILGYEGHGSLIEYLRKRVWGLELYAGSDESGSDHNSYFLHFGLTVSLTEEGYSHIDEVLQAIFSYLELMRKEGPQERIYNELKTIQETKFRFSPEPSPGDNVEELSENMQKYPSKHYLSGPELYFKYDADAITKCLSYLSPENVNIMILNNNNKEEYEKKEDWFNTPYNVTDVPSDWLQHWKDVIPLESFKLPEPNPYLTKNFTVFAPEDEIDFPVNIVNDTMGELWFKQDKKFNLPRAYIIFQIVSPLIFFSPENACMLDLMIGGLKQKLTTEVYPAQVAELSYSINPSEAGTGQGISLMIAGYNEKLPLLMETILKEWKNFEENFNEELFVAIKDVIKKSYYNSALKPSKLMKDVTNSILKSVHWTVIEKYDAIDDITFEQLKLYSKQLKQRLYCRMLIQGNMLKDQALDTYNIVHRTLQYKQLITNTWPQLRLIQLPVGEAFLTVDSVNKNSSNSAIAQTYYCGLGNMRYSCVAEMMMLLFEEAAFDFLRTKEQLGYSVGTSVSIIKGILRFSVAVNNQEDKNNLTHVDGKIQEFLVKFYDDLKNMTSEEIEQLRKSAMRQKLQADVQLREEVDRNWEEVYTEEHIFNRRQLEYDIIETITHEEMLQFFNKFVLNPSERRIMTVAVKGLIASEEVTYVQDKQNKCGHDEMCLKYVDSGDLKRTVTKVKNIAEYKRSLFYYPAHKIIN
ncbi:nardilysin-like isoform X2 [Neocloeon triangulifer]|nr:nardilysin-like isoform X2 [Neocloeon triangulifer]